LIVTPHFDIDLSTQTKTDEHLHLEKRIVKRSEDKGKTALLFFAFSFKPSMNET